MTLFLNTKFYFKHSLLVEYKMENVFFWIPNRELIHRLEVAVFSEENNLGYIIKPRI